MLGSGHYANVLRLGERTGLALSTDGVGTKLIVAEQLGRFDTVGIDCIAMNVNDVICVGADPIAVLDYIAVEEAGDGVLAAVGEGLKAGAEDAGVEIPGGELAVVPELIRGHPSPGGHRPGGHVRRAGGPRRDRDRSRAPSPGDAIIGLPSSGVHSQRLHAGAAGAARPRRDARRARAAAASATPCSSPP